LINTKVNVLIEEWKSHKAATTFSYQVIAVVVFFSAFLVFATFWINTAFIYLSTPGIFLALWSSSGWYMARLYVFDMRCNEIEGMIRKNVGEKVLDWEYTGGRFLLSDDNEDANPVAVAVFKFQNQFYMLSNVIVFIAMIIIIFMGFSLIWVSNPLIVILLGVLYAIGYSGMGYLYYLFLVKKSFEDL